MNWQSKAACIGEDPKLFHSDKKGGAAANDIRDAKKVCARCPGVVKQHCLAFALAMESADDCQDRYGVFGGMGPKERKLLMGGRAA